MRCRSLSKKPHKNPMLTSGFGIFELIVSLALISISIAAINLLVLSATRLSNKSVKAFDQNLKKNSWSISDLSLCEDQTSNLSKCTKQSVTRYQFKSE